MSTKAFQPKKSETVTRLLEHDQATRLSGGPRCPTARLRQVHRGGSPPQPVIIRCSRPSDLWAVARRSTRWNSPRSDTPGCASGRSIHGGNRLQRYIPTIVGSGVSTSVPEASTTGAAAPPVVVLAVGDPSGCGAPWSTALRWRPHFLRLLVGPAGLD